MNWNVIQYESLDSTNTFAWEQLSQGLLRHGDVVQAFHQTSGRGRFNNRNWTDEAGKSLLMSVVLTEIDSTVLPLLSFISGVAVLRAIRRATLAKNADRVKLKWPNDVLIDRLKVSGILVENCWSGSELKGSVVGIGVNINQEELPGELMARATSLKQSFGKAMIIDILRDYILGEMKTLLALDRALLLTQIRREIDWMSYMRGITVDLLEGATIKNAQIKGITEDGALLVIDGEKTKTIYAATLTLPFE